MEDTKLPTYTQYKIHTITKLESKNFQKLNCPWIMKPGRLMGTYFSDCQSPVANGIGFMDCEHRIRRKVEAPYKAGSCDKRL